MNKLHVAIFGALLMAFVIVPSFGCSENLETTTGAACSIADLNNLQEKNAVKVKVNTTDRVDRNLRPVSISNKANENVLYSLDCRIGVCVPRLRLVSDE
jgi:hypothetical protein